MFTKKSAGTRKLSKRKIGLAYILKQMVRVNIPKIVSLPFSFRDVVAGVAGVVLATPVFEYF